MSARDVLDVVDVLDQDGVDVWVDGGWGIEALLEAQHRDHDDVDLVVPVEHLDAAVTALAGVGFAVDIDDRPTRVSLGDRTGRRVDLHPVHTDGQGLRWRTAGRPDGTDARYPADQFTTGWIGGRPVPCVGVLLQVEQHRGYPPGAVDREDLARLQQRFGVLLPPEYR